MALMVYSVQRFTISQFGMQVRRNPVRRNPAMDEGRQSQVEAPIVKGPETLSLSGSQSGWRPSLISTTGLVVRLERQIATLLRSVPADVCRPRSGGSPHRRFRGQAVCGAGELSVPRNSDGIRQSVDHSRLGGHDPASVRAGFSRSALPVFPGRRRETRDRLKASRATCRSRTALARRWAIRRRARDSH